MHTVGPQAPARQTLGEEIANSATHGVGAALAVAVLVVLVTLAARRGDAWRVFSLATYGATLLVLYLTSTLYHALPGPRVKRVFRLLDHVSIYLLIAGTYTPVALGPMRGPWGWSIFGMIWGLAVGGILSKIFLFGRLRILSVLFYVAMGWSILVALRPMLRMVPSGLVAWLGAGGVCYTLGVVFFAWKGLRFQHAIWHLFVLAGSACHFVGLLLYVTEVR